MSALGFWYRLAVASVLLHGVLEAALVASAGAEPKVALVSGLFSAATTGLVFGAVTPGLLLSRFLRAHPLRLALATLPFTLAMASPLSEGRAASFGGIALLSSLGVAAAAFFARSEPRHVGLIASALLTCAALALDLYVGPADYPEVHALAFVVVTAGLGALLPDRTSQRAPLKFAALVAGSVAAVVMITRAQVDAYSWSLLHGRNVARTLAWLRLPFDLDRDGFSFALRGGDCRDDDPARNPASPDPPGQGDQNCNGVDGADHAPATLFPARVGSPALAVGSIDRVVVLSLDTFRPELLDPAIMPNLARLASHGLDYARSYAGATATTESLPLFERPRRDEPSVRRLLDAHGVEHMALGMPADLRLAPGSGGPDPALIARALARLRTHTAPHMLWLHLMGLHGDYIAWPDVPSPPARPPLHENYVREAVHLDSLLADLIAWLERPEIRARSVVVITGDHGEGFREHGVASHSRLGWEEMVRTPIVLLAPNLRPGRVDLFASHRDIPPTIAGALGMNPESSGLERFGRSLLRSIGHEREPLRAGVFIKSARTASGAMGHGPLGVLIMNDHKLVHGSYDQVTELYDLRRDEKERRNLATLRPELVRALKRVLLGHADADGVQQGFVRH